MTEFNRKDVYDKKIQPIVSELKKQCELNTIPMFVTCCVANSDEKTEYKSDAISTGSKGIVLKDDHLEKHLCVANGFQVVPPNVGNKLSEDDFEYIDDIDDIDDFNETESIEEI